MQADPGLQGGVQLAPSAGIPLPRPEAAVPLVSLVHVVVPAHTNVAILKPAFWMQRDL